MHGVGCMGQGRGGRGQRGREAERRRGGSLPTLQGAVAVCSVQEEFFKILAQPGRGSKPFFGAVRGQVSL
jgi:hypothetical protein